MKKLPVKQLTLSFSPLFFIALLTQPVQAASWVEIDHFDDGIRIFADQKNLRRTANVAHLAHLVRWSEPQIEPDLPPYWSTIVQVDYDCNAKKEKYVSSISYAGKMGDGAAIISDEDAAGDWADISPDSMEEKLLKFACEK